MIEERDKKIEWPQIICNWFISIG